MQYTISNVAITILPTGWLELAANFSLIVNAPITGQQSVNTAWLIDFGIVVQSGGTLELNGYTNNGAFSTVRYVFLCT